MSKFQRIAGFVPAAVLALGLGSSGAMAQLTVDVTTGHDDPLPIAVTRFVGADDESGVGTSIADVVAADLERSGLFRPLDRRSFIQTGEQIGEDEMPSFGAWRTIGAEALITGWVVREADGRLRVSFRLFETSTEDQMVGFVYRGPESIWRRIAHKIADAVYERLTGDSGYFDTRIVYIAESGPQTDLVKRLAIMDQDGANRRLLSNLGRLNLTPRFSPTAQQITYMSYVNDVPRVYLLKLESGVRSVLGDFRNMTFAPRFSPDGRKIVMSLAVEGNTDIYEMDLATRFIKRLTTDPAIDTSPSYSPDGTQVTFSSDRGGEQQIYVMDTSGTGDARRITYRDGSYSTPVWSPRGDLIAFTRQDRRNGFSIGVMGTDGGGERLIASGDLVEGPTWAPNGRVLMFSRDTYDIDGRGTSRTLHSIDITGRNERLVETHGNATDPAWSPLLP